MGGKWCMGLKKLWEIASALEYEGNPLAEELYEIHDEIKYKLRKGFVPRKEVFEGIPMQALYDLCKALGRKSYDPRTLQVALAIILTRSGGEMDLDRVARELGMHKGHLRSRLRKARYFRIVASGGKEKVVADKIAMEITRMILGKHGISPDGKQDS